MLTRCVITRLENFEWGFGSNFEIVRRFQSNEEVTYFFKEHLPLLLRVVPLACRTRQIYQGIPWRWKYVNRQHHLDF